MSSQSAGLPELPKAPKRSLTVWDVTMLIGLPVITYVGGVAAGFGNAIGLVLSGFAALGVVAFRALRLGRRNEPRIPRYAQHVSVAVAVLTLVTAWGLYRQAPQPDTTVYVMPAVSVLSFLVLVLLMFRRAR